MSTHVAHPLPAPSRRYGELLAWIVAVTLAVLAGAALLSWSRAPAYRATADVLVEALSTPTVPPDMGTERAVGSSTTVLELAGTALGVPAADLYRGLSVTVPVDTHVLRIADTQGDPADARRRAQAVAEGYVAYRSRQISSPVTARVISPAMTPQDPVSPNHSVDLSVALVVGLSLGVGVALVRDRLDDRLRGPADLATRVGAPLLGVVPAFRGWRRGPMGRLAVLDSPESGPADGYRDIRTRIARPTSPEAIGSTLLVTSAAGEDRGTVAANLAVALAVDGQRVVLVCADLRQSRACAVLGLDDAPGLADIVSGGVELADALRGTDVPGLRVLPPGHVGHDLVAVLGAPALPWTLSLLRHQADHVIVEGPAVLAGVHAELLADQVDRIAVVADARRSRRGPVDRAVAVLGPWADRLAGCVLDNAGRRHRLPRPPAGPVDPEPVDEPGSAQMPGLPEMPTLPRRSVTEDPMFILPARDAPISGR
ncbi:hypothetical protein R8Z50_24190 [Longispora sp. K20-0274]|uniref:hypothetical protein n=1 Tax=Longispora sp. K20-0274 TaxID=3088255 RepID=UPI00399C1579